MRLSEAWEFDVLALVGARRSFALLCVAVAVHGGADEPRDSAERIAEVDSCRIRARGGECKRGGDNEERSHSGSDNAHKPCFTSYTVARGTYQVRLYVCGFGTSCGSRVR